MIALAVVLVAGFLVGIPIAFALGLASLAASNEFNATQHLDGDALLWRFRDTGASGKEWGIRSDGGNLEICENTGTEGSPTWTVRKTFVSGIADAIGLPRSYLAGLGMSNAADADHDITIAVGTARDSANAYDLTFSSAMTKQIDAAWAAGTAAGGMFTGVVGNETWYHVHLIRKDSDGTIDAGFDTSITAANKPAGYSNYRRIGSVLTNGSANILAFYQKGDYFLWKASILDIDVTNPGTARVLDTLSVPLGVVVEARINARFYDSDGAFFGIITDPNQNDEAPSATAAPLRTHSTNAGGEAADRLIHVYTNTSSQIAYRVDVSDANTTIKIATLGWSDRRGRDD